MTKVVGDESILDYQREMAETVREVIRSQYIAGVKAWDMRDSLRATAGSRGSPVSTHD